MQVGKYLRLLLGTGIVLLSLSVFAQDLQTVDVVLTKLPSLETQLS